MSGAKFRRVYLDHGMDGRIDRVRCEQGEERCDLCRASDTMMDELKAQRQANVQQDHYQHDHEGRQQNPDAHHHAMLLEKPIS